MKKTKTKTQHDLDRYCIFCIIFFVLFTIAEITVSSITGVTHERLTEAVQWFCGGELFFCAMLKRLKIKKEENTNEYSGTDYIRSDTNSRAN